MEYRFAIFCVVLSMITLTEQSKGDEVYQGCFIDKYSRDLPYEQTDLVSSEMTREDCIYSCLTGDFLYAALQNGKMCFCGNTFGRYGMVDGAECDALCMGNSGPLCGGSLRNSIFATGKSPPKAHTCGNGEGVQVGNMCYIFRTSPVDWVEAQQQCVIAGGNLVTDIDRELQNLLEYNTRFFGHADYWIGLHDMGKEGTYTFTDEAETPLGSWNNFQKGQPDDTTGKSDCVELKLSYGYKWNDVSCTNSKGYICQVKVDGDIPCGRNFDGVSIDAHCFTLVEKPARWSEAMFDCSLRGGTLASIRDSVTQTFLTRTALKTGSKTGWYFGLNDIAVEGQYEYPDGSQLTQSSFTKYADGEPNDDKETSDNDCTILSYDSNCFWNDVSCNKEYNYICELGNAPGSACPHGWSEFEGHCYILYEKGSTYSDSMGICNQTGGEFFLKIESQAEADFIVSEFVSSKSFHIWLGLTDVEDEGTFTWYDGSGIDFADWDSNNPDDVDGTQDCAYIAKATNKWRDVECGVTYIRTVCEMAP
ncbi:C-type mannose receptor 2-like isoform X2 [Ptychodera flava]|uniref:C-type mannose receptor 2-like isoform X2 n=1 Tax=Ptychodera flava TaxID=63121 RepID=UPI00396A52A1